MCAQWAPADGRVLAVALAAMGLSLALHWLVRAAPICANGRMVMACLSNHLLYTHAASGAAPGGDAGVAALAVGGL